MGFRKHNILINALEISIMHIIYFNDIHSLPLPKVLPDILPNKPLPPASCSIFFLYNPESPICAAHSLYIINPPGTVYS